MGVTAQTVTEPGTVGEDGQSASRLFGPRGRHRRPRPRKVLLAAGGLALAAGALSLVRLAPETDVTALGTAESDPAPVSGTDAATARSTNAAATVRQPPAQPSPSATAAMGRLGTTPTTTRVVVPSRSTPAKPPHGSSDTTTDGAQIQTPAPHPPTQSTRPPRPPATEPQTQPPGQNSPSAPAPEPDRPEDDTVCVPVIGVCVDPLTTDD